jgi:molybdopterin synthase sulfur carrier subunit
MPSLRIDLPLHLRRLANLASHEATVMVAHPVTVSATLDALETLYPALLGTIRDQTTNERRAFLRIFVCEEDWSHESTDRPLPDAIVSGKEPLLIIGAIAGG